MDSLDLQVLTEARRWFADGRRVWLVTVLETWGSAPRPPGALLALRDDGQVVGSVSGGCVEDDLIDRVRHGERVDTPALVNYGVSKEEAARFGLPCGGNLRLLQEPLSSIAWIDELLARTARHELVARRLDLGRGDPVLHLQRLRSLGGQPRLFEDIWLLLPLCAALPEVPLAEWGDLLYPFLAERCGVAVARAQDEIAFAPLTPAQSRVLDLSAGHPGVRVSRQAYDLAGRCVEWRTTCADAFAFHYTVTIT